MDCEGFSSHHHCQTVICTSSQTDEIECRILWSKLKVVALAHLAAQAKQKAKQALEIADAVAQEERVAMQQYELSFFPPGRVTELLSLLSRVVEQRTVPHGQCYCLVQTISLTRCLPVFVYLTPLGNSDA